MGVSQSEHVDGQLLALSYKINNRSNFRSMAGNRDTRYMVHIFNTVKKHDIL